MYRQTSLTVTHNGTPLTNVLSASASLGLGSRVASAQVEVSSLPAGIVPWDTIAITMGGTAGTAATRFTGYFVSADKVLWPKRVVLNCRGRLARAEALEAETNVDMSSGGAGHLDQVMVATVLYICGLAGAFVPSGETEMDGIGGTGKTLGKYAKARGFQWDEGESGLSFIDRLDQVCLGYRTYDTFDGTIKRTQITTVPAASAVATFTEHVDIAAASETTTILEARNKIIVTGFPGYEGNAAISYTAIGANPFLVSSSGQWYLTHKTSAQMIEQQNAGAGDGLSCEEVANWLLGEKNSYRESVSLTTPRDDVIEPGDTIAVTSPTRLGFTDRKFWVEGVNVSVSRNGQFSQTFGCRSGIPLTESNNGAVLGVVASMTAAAVVPSVTVIVGVTAVPASATAAAVAPTVQLSAYGIEAVVASAVVAALAPAVSAGASIVAVTASMTAAAVAPSTVGVLVSVTAVVASATAAAVVPAVTGGAAVTAEVASALAAAIAPSVSAAAGTEATFGETEVGSTSFDGDSVSYVVGGVFTSGEAGTLQKLTAWLKKTGSPNAKRVKAAVYSDTTLLYTSTTELTGADLTTSMAKYDFEFSSGKIAASTDYVLVLMIESGDGSNYISFSRNSNYGTSKTQVLTYGNFPATATWSSGNRYYSIYATYLV